MFDQEGRRVLFGIMEGGAIVIGKARGDKRWQVKIAIERNSLIIGLEMTNASLKEQISGCYVNGY